MMRVLNFWTSETNKRETKPAIFRIFEFLLPPPKYDGALVFSTPIYLANLKQYC